MFFYIYSTQFNFDFDFDSARFNLDFIFHSAQFNFDFDLTQFNFYFDFESMRFNFDFILTRHNFDFDSTCGLISTTNNCQRVNICGLYVLAEVKVISDIFCIKNSGKSRRFVMF